MSVLSAAFSKGQAVDAIYNKGQIVYKKNSSPADALFARMDEQPSDSIKTLIRSCIDALVEKGLWQKLDCLWVVGNTEQQSCINWISANFTAIPNGAINFVPYRGYKGNGANFYLQSQFDPSAQIPLGSHFQQDSMSFGGSIQDTDGTAAKAREVMGWGYGGSLALIEIFPESSQTNLTTFKLGVGANLVATSDIKPYHWMGVRTSSLDAKLYRNTGTLYSTTNLLSGAYPNDGTNTGVVLGARIIKSGGNWVLSRFTNARHSHWFIGGALSDDDVYNFYYIMNAYLAGVGAEEIAIQPQSYAKIALGPKNLLQGNVVNYSLSMRNTGTRQGSISIEQEGDLTDANFDKSLLSAIATACNSTTGVTISGNTLTFTNQFTGPLNWSRTLTNSPGNGKVHAIRLTNETGIKVEIPFACQICGTVTMPATPSKYRGVNMSGGDFNPPLYWTTQGELQPYINAGATCIRLPFRWESLQPVPFGPLNMTIANIIKGQINLITSNGLYAAPEFHNYGQYYLNGTALSIGDAALPISAWVDVVKKFLQFIGNENPKIIFGTMNEPIIAGDTWRSAAKAAHDQARAVGFNNEIWVPGSGYTGAHSWISGGNAARFADFTDPITDVVVHDMHQYLDDDSSGTHPNCTIGGSTRMDTAFAWCAANNRKVIIGEFGCGNPTTNVQCATELPALIAKMNSDPVCKGGMAWGGGPFWGTYFMAFMTPLPPGPALPTAYGQTVINNWPVV